MQKKSITFIIILLFFAFPIFAQGILINEIAWMGTKENSNDEWIELKNNTDNIISLENYKLIIGEKEIPLKGKINPNSFFILERTDDNSLPNIKANQIYTGSLKNSGTKIQLFNQNKLIDEADFSLKWTCGNNSTKQTCERINNEWQTSIENNGSPNIENIENKNENKIQETIYLENDESHFPFEIVIPLSLFFGIIGIFINKSLNLQ